MPPTSDAVTVTWTVTRQTQRSHLRAVRLAAALSPQTAVIVAAVVAWLLLYNVAVELSLRGRHHIVGDVIFSAWCALFIAAVLPLSRMWAAARRARLEYPLDVTVWCQLDANGFRVANAGGETYLLWRQAHGLRRTRRLISYIAPGHFTRTLLPARLFGDGSPRSTGPATVQPRPEPLPHAWMVTPEGRQTILRRAWFAAFLVEYGWAVMLACVCWLVFASWMVHTVVRDGTPIVDAVPMLLVPLMILTLLYMRGRQVRRQGSGKVVELNV